MESNQKSPLKNPLVILLSLSVAFFLVFLISLGVLYRSSAVKSAAWKPTPTNTPGDELIGVIEVKGVIMDSKKTLRQLKMFEEDTDVKGVLVRLNSPGGAVGPSQEIYEAVKKYPKPIVASMASVAASGAYYIACGIPKVFANAGTLTGSIGVIMEFANLKKLYDWAKIERYSIKTGKFKDSGAEYRDMMPEEKALLQELVDNTLGQFREAVETGRKLTPEKVAEVADGRIFTGKQALALGLVDQLGTMDDAVNALAEAAKIKGKPKLVYPGGKPRSLIELLTSDMGEEDEEYEGRSGIAGSAAGRALLGAVGLGAETGAKIDAALGKGLPTGTYFLWSLGH
jgi:protease IV